MLPEQNIQAVGSGQHGPVLPKALYESVFANSPHYHAISRFSDGVLVEVNGAFEKITGYSRSEAIGRTSSDLGLWVDHGQRDALIAKLQPGGVVSEEVKYKTKDGRVLDCEITVSHFSSDGEDFLLAILSDKSAEIAAKQSKIEIENRFKSLFECSLDAIIVIDGDGIIEISNAAAGEMFGYESAELIGKKIKSLMPNAPADKRDDFLESYAKTSVKTVIEQSRQISAKRHNGELFQAHISIAEISTPVGIKFAATIRDISRQVEATQTTNRLNEQLRDTINVLEKINQDNNHLSEMIDLLHACQSFEEAASIVAHYLPQLFPDAIGELYTFDDSNRDLECVVYWGHGSGKPHPIQAADCWGLRRGRLFEMLDTSRDIVCSHISSASGGYQICCPLLAQGDDIGLLHLVFADHIDALHKRLAQAVADHISLGMANIRLRDHLREQAIKDPLSGLYNRRHLDDTFGRELSRCIRNNRPLSVWMIDIDNFKRFNDDRGHDAGDVVLATVAEKFRTLLRNEDILCRFGGEEFVAVLPEFSLNNSENRAELARQSIYDLCIEHDDITLPKITVSIGVSAFPEHGKAPSNLLRAADHAMYRAKENGRNQVVVATEQDLRAD